MKIYRFTGSNISGGVHNSSFIVIAESKEKARQLILDMLKKQEPSCYYELSDFGLYDTVEEEDIKEGIVEWDTGDCC